MGDSSLSRLFLSLRHNLGLQLLRRERFLHALDLAEAESIHHSLRAPILFLLRFVATHKRGGVFHDLVVIVVVTLVE